MDFTQQFQNNETPLYSVDINNVLITAYAINMKEESYCYSIIGTLLDYINKLINVDVIEAEEMVPGSFIYSITESLTVQCWLQK